MKKNFFLFLILILVTVLFFGVSCEEGNLRDLKSGQAISSEVIAQEIRETGFFSARSFAERESALKKVKNVLSKAETADMLINAWNKFQLDEKNKNSWVEFTGSVLEEVCDHLADNFKSRPVVDRNYAQQIYIRIISNPHIHYIDGYTESKWLDRIRELVAGKV